MHETSLAFMSQSLPMRLDGLTVLDVGSLDVNGTYRPLIVGRGGRCVGLDLVSGPNVDVVAAAPYRYPFEAEFDLVISGSTAEHVERVWEWVPELARCAKPGGVVVIVTHWMWPLHNHPDDYWRFMPSGLRVLMEMAGLVGIEIRMFEDGTIGAKGEKMVRLSSR